MDVRTFKYALSAFAADGRGEMHRGAFSCPKSTKVRTGADLIKWAEQVRFGVKPYSGVCELGSLRTWNWNSSIEERTY